MKKIKVTRRPGSNFILRPSRIRMFGVYIIILTLAISTGLFIRFLFSRDSFSPEWFKTDLLPILGLIIGGAILVTFLEYSRWTLRVENGEKVEGPAGAFGERLSIPIKDINWVRTRRSLDSWLKFGNGIYASSRNRILVSPCFFEPGQFREFLTEIGYDKALK